MQCAKNKKGNFAYCGQWHWLIIQVGLIMTISEEAKRRDQDIYDRDVSVSVDTSNSAWNIFWAYYNAQKDAWGTQRISADMSILDFFTPQNWPKNYSLGLSELT